MPVETVEPDAPPSPPSLPALSAGAWEQVKDLFRSERGTWHHAEEIAARLRLDPAAVGEALERVSGEGQALERCEVKDTTAPAVRGTKIIQVPAVYYRVRQK
jgi:uncharacterized Fe-S cluster-containing radical SAM superfamily protein